MPLILGISGSLRAGYHTALLRAAATQLPPGVSIEVYGELREIPPYDADLDVQPAEPTVSKFREAIATADGLLIATPEYNGSIPGVSRTPSTGRRGRSPTTRSAGSPWR
jgi:chromate reductase